ncbi:hypothetical protein IAU60_003549 [Kwoniella sp. DSM 27419]
MYTALAEYSLNPCDPASRNGTGPTPRRMSIQPGLDGAYSTHTSIDSTADCSQATAMSPASTSTSLASVMSTQQRLSMSSRQRRPSPLLHEIQPPSRRLSAHQMMLLTPFGGSLPAGTLSSGSMSRGSSSMGGGPMTAPPRLSGSAGSGWPRRDSATSTGPSPTSSAKDLPALNRFPPRSRHSLGHAVVAPSPLASAPMSTIFSGSSEGGSSSREASAQDGQRNQVFMSRDEVGIDADRDRRQSGRFLPATVAMTRSNSLPVLTLRELEALKEKDGELGIQRGGDWAWVSRGSIDEREDTASTSTTSLDTPYEQQPFTSFQDPFAALREEPRGPTYTPKATSSDYRYSPSAAEPRRRSDIHSSFPSPTSRGRRSTTDRRTSIPTPIRYSFSAATPRLPDLSPTHETTGTFTGAPPDEPSPRGSPSLASAPGFPQRPRILRYKTSPARYTGLGLNIRVRASGSSGSDQSAGSESDPRARPQPRSRTRGSLGNWAEVDLVDPLAASTEVPYPIGMSRTSSSISPTDVTHRESISLTAVMATRGSVASASTRGSVHSAASAPVTTTKPAFIVEHIGSRSHLTAPDAEPAFRGRSRFESVDSAFPLMPGGSGGRLAVPAFGAGDTYGHRSSIGSGSELEEGYPRRGSMGMGTFARLRSAAFARTTPSDVDDLGVRVARARMSSASSVHWSERRGSWAEVPR